MICWRGFLWKPEYGKSISQGLPQVNLPAIRLLANFMLFDIDDYLLGKTDGDFVRWMDDIDFASNSKAEARKILRDLEILLNSMGLRLNTGKTKILSPEEAMESFCINENRKANDMKNHIDSYKIYGNFIKNTILARLSRELDELLSGDKCGAWNKVVARYINFFAKIGVGHSDLLKIELLLLEPSLRSTIFRYYLKLGFSNRRMRNVFTYILSDACLDDASFSEAVDLIVRWRINKRNKYIDKLIRYFNTLPYRTDADLHRLSNGLKFMMKYATSDEISLYIDAFSNLWPESEWLARQVAACYPILESSTQRKIRYVIANSGRKEGMRIIHTLDRMKDSTGVSDLDKPILKEQKISLVKVSLIVTYLSGSLSSANKKRLIEDYKIKEYGDFYIKHALKAYISPYI